MSVNSSEFYKLQTRLEDIKNNLKRYKSTDLSFAYNVQELEETADEILKSLATEWLTCKEYREEYGEDVDYNNDDELLD